MSARPLISSFGDDETFRLAVDEIRQKVARAMSDQDAVVAIAALANTALNSPRVTSVARDFAETVANKLDLTTADLAAAAHSLNAEHSVTGEVHGTFELVGQIEGVVTPKDTSSGLSPTDWINLWTVVYGTVLSTLAAKRGDAIDASLIASATVVALIILQAIRKRSS